MTQARLVAFAEQVEHADALPEIVIRVGRAPRRRVKPSSHPQELAPGAAHRARLDSAGNTLEPLPGSLDAAEDEQGLDRGQLRLQRVHRRRIARAAPLHRKWPTRSTASPRRKASARLERTNGPLIPAARDASVPYASRAFCKHRLASSCSTADQMNLRERIEDGASRLAHEMQRDFARRARD